MECRDTICRSKENLVIMAMEGCPHNIFFRHQSVATDMTYQLFPLIHILPDAISRGNPYITLVILDHRTDHLVCKDLGMRVFLHFIRLPTIPVKPCFGTYEHVTILRLTNGIALQVFQKSVPSTPIKDQSVRIHHRRAIGRRYP